jgi:hypothetical protein
MAVLAFAAVVSVAAAADLKKGVTDPAEAGSDFAVQGEYAGEMLGPMKFGVQVIALGDG